MLAALVGLCNIKEGEDRRWISGQRLGIYN